VKVRKLSVSFDPELGDAVRGAADRARQTLSGWLAEAAAAKLRADALADFLDSWEAEHGAITEEELTAAASRLRLPIPATNQMAVDQDQRRSPGTRARGRLTRTAGSGQRQ
jgi:hypothetical protein